MRRIPNLGFAAHLFGVAGWLLTLASQAPATVLLDESFNYANGALVTVSGGAWHTHSGIAGQVEVAGGRAYLNTAETEDVNALLAGQPYPSTTNTVLYASFTANFAGLPSASGEYFAHFKDNTTGNFRAKVFALLDGEAGGQFRIGIANASNGPAAVAPSKLSLNADFRICVRYVVSNATTTLWVDPVSEASPSVSAGDTATPRTVISIALREDSGIGIMALDDLRVGTSFADVYSPPPVVSPKITLQPVGAAAVEGGAATFTVVASGTQPLSYQWRFMGVDLPGYTTSTLTLSNVSPTQAGSYSVVVSNAAGTTNSVVAVLTVVGPSSSGTLTLVTYNVKGNFASDWSTNAPQVQAIARQLLYLDPDIITLNEIPNALRYEMTNWMIAFFPTHSLAVSPGTDGAIRSGVISRFPISRSQSWLDGASLTNFGYAGTFTRDLFEVEINVAGATEPLHVFTTHLKSGSDPDSQGRRAAEASAVSNFLALSFLPANASRPYVLTGDMNEDITIPMSQNKQPIQRLISAATGLKLTTPVNPFTLGRFTHSIQGSNALDARFDYILPAGALSSNIAGSQVFRTDQLPAPPSPMLANDDITASDHLPVVMVFRYPDPPLQVTLAVNNQEFALIWPALIGRRFLVEASVDLTNWSVAASNLITLANSHTWTTPGTDGRRFFRVVRVP